MAQPGDTRVELVLRAAERWRNDLVGASSRNPLRGYRDLKTGTLDLTPDQARGLDTHALDRLLDDKPVSLSALFPEALGGASEVTDFNDARRRLNVIRKTALTNFEEKGVETLFAAVGLATWKVNSGAAPNAPVVLLPLRVAATGAAARDFKIEVAGDAHINPVLAHIMRSEYGIATEEEEVEIAESPPICFRGFIDLLKRFEESWKALPQLDISPRMIVANFSYSMMPLVVDLERNGALFAASDIVAAIAGDKGAHAALASRICDPKANQPDIDPPHEEFLVLDADSSQHIAINRVLGGESLVIQGPPGTGKSQTIANLITALIARDKRVLFVAEKRAAIEAVTKRLTQVGLGDLVMDMHGGIKSRRDFARSLDESLRHVAAIPAQDYSVLHGRLLEYKKSLIANDAALHQAREPWNLSVFDIGKRLLAAPEDARTSLRLSTQAARILDSAGYEQLTREINEWISLDGHNLEVNHPEWFRSTITSSEEARRAFELAKDLVQNQLPNTRAALFAVLDELSLSHGEMISEWGRITRFLSVENKSWWERLMAQIFSGEYKAVKQSLGVSTSLSIDSSTMEQLEIRVNALTEGLAEISNVTGLEDMSRIAHTELASMLERMTSNRTVAANLSRIREIEARFEKAGVEDVIKSIGEEIPIQHAMQAVEWAWLQKILELLEFDDQRIAGFDSNVHSMHRDEFAKSDREHIGSTPQRVRRLTAEATIQIMNAYPQESQLIGREAAKKRRHLSVRQLWAQAPHILSTLRPCWAMSPILAAEIVPADQQLFDVVVFDEASQIPPAEAIGSLARAPQVVIAGDRHQLPPTSFFGHSLGSEADDDESDDIDASGLVSDSEALLNVANAFLRDKMLQWHYRSQDDRLIAFSNGLIYGGSLTTFPGYNLNTPVSHYLIPFRPIHGVKGTRSNPDEVERVVELILKHAREHSSETLGVIAFGQHHANNIDNRLRQRLSDENAFSLDEFFSEANEERFFVKNIERVQGDERDAIILSVGYHKDINGNLPYRFGPILQEGGERRLNVAVTRARSRLTLVSSFSHLDMDPNRSEATGVELLRGYLEYAASGGESLSLIASATPLNPFELSVKDGLERRGIPITPQYGVSGYRIDFACAHPDEPGRMVLAIEADGARVHSIPTVRDRDRLRQQVLESKGWRFHRIWSTAWFRDREAELDKAEKAWKLAVKASEDGDPPTDPAPPADIPPDNPSPQRGPRPNVPRKGTRGYNSITDYEHWQLVSLVRWIESDTLLRTDDQLIQKMIKLLGFKRAGARIQERLRMAIRAAHR